MLYTIHMTEAEAKTQLEAEGCRNISAWLDSPDFFYSDHSHTEATSHIVVSGRMSLTMNGVEHQLGPGDRIDIPAMTIHSVVMGPAGCTYVSGDK